MYCACPAAAQDVVAGDTTYFNDDTATYNKIEEGDTTDVNAEYEEQPPRVVIYNKATPDDVEWNQAIGREPYRYRDKREYVKTKEDDKPEEEPDWIKAILRFFVFLGSPLGQILLWMAFILIVGYIVYRVMAGHSGRLFGRRDRKKDIVDNEGTVSEEGLLGSDWEIHLKAALAAGDTRLAIRYSYMNLLQALQERGLIIYRPDKTNTEYHRELIDSMRQPFLEVSRQYEYTWYGNFLPEPAQMEYYMQTYSGLKKSITYA